MRTYIDWCKLLNRLTEQAYKATTPAQYNYWWNHRTRLSKLLNAKGWSF